MSVINSGCCFTDIYLLYMNVLFLVCLFDSGCCLTGVCLCCRAADVNLLAVLAEKDEIIAELRQEGKQFSLVD